MQSGQIPYRINYNSINGNDNRFIFTSPQDGDIVQYDASQNKFINTNWLHHYLLDSPPQIVFDATNSDTQYLYLPWQIPQQIPCGFMAILLPVILSLTLQLTIPSLSWNPQSVLTADTGHLNISGLVLTGLAPAGLTFTSMTVPGEAAPRDVALYSHASLLNLPYSDSNLLNAFYSNYNTTMANNSFVIIPAYQTSGVPTAPRTLTFSAVTSTGMTINYIAPLYSDSVNNTNTIAIAGYKATYDTSGSLIRYPSPIAHSLQTDTYGNDLSHALSTTLYPDATYSINVSAKNAVNPNYGATVSGTQITSYLAQPASLGTLAFSTSRFSASAYSASDTSLTPTLYNNVTTSSADWTASQTMNINQIANRGLLSGSTNPLMTIGMIYDGTSGPSLTYRGYGGAVPTTTTTANQTLTPVSITDAYGIAEQQGFYQNANITATLLSGAFVTSASQRTITLDQSFTNPTATTVSQTFNFYYNSIVGNPGTPGSVTWNLSSGATTAVQISGVYVFYATPSFTASSSITNMGTYFWASPLTQYNYSIGGLTASYSRTNINSSVTGITAGLMSSPIGVTDSFTSTNLLSTFEKTAGNAQLTALIAKNLNGTTTYSASTTLTIVCDGPSYNLLFNILPSSIPTISTSSGSVIGKRCYSGAVAYVSVLPAWNFNSAQYKTYDYDNALLLTATPGSGTVQDQRQELQVANGCFTNYDTAKGYIDYSIYKYASASFNTANYSALSGTRWATFTWQVGNNTNLYNTLSFELYGLNVTPTITGGVAYLGGNALNFLYRVEDSTSAVAGRPDTTQTYLTGNWADAMSVNGTLGTPINPANYSTPGGTTPTGTYGGLSTGAYYTSGVLSIPVNFPSRLFSVSGTNVSITCRVGIPYGAYSFTYVKASII